MSENKLNITPETRVGTLLQQYPQLEQLLLEMSPSFVALKNPILRKTVAKVTSLQQAAKVGNVNPITMVNALRAAIGDEPLQSCYSNELEVPFSSSTRGESKAVLNSQIVKTIDVRPLLAEGNHPKELILNEAESLNKDQGLKFIAPFPPTPLIDILKEKGFTINTEMIGAEEFHVEVYR